MLLLALFILLLSYYFLRGCIRPKDFPPGPLNFPVFGGLVHFRGDMLHTMKMFEKAYGKVFSFNMGSNPVVVVADYGLYQELANKDDFAARPGMQAMFFYE